MPRVLYIEDEHFLARIVKESLESRSFEIIHAGDGEEGFRLFLDSNPDICVLDVMLPNKDGFKLAQEIRSINPFIPIIFLTAKNQSADVIKGFTSGGNDFLRKPFSMEELILRINNLLNLTGQKDHSKNSERIGTFEYFPDRMILRLGGIENNLSHKENEILKILMEYKNQKVDRVYLLQQVWGNDSFFNSRTLDVYIRKLRAILEADANIKILTLRGVGYTFYVGS